MKSAVNFFTLISSILSLCIAAIAVLLYVLYVIYTIIRVHSAFSLVASCVLLKYTRTDDVN